MFEIIREYYPFAVLAILIIVEIWRNKRLARIDEVLGEMSYFLDHMAVIQVVDPNLVETEDEELL